MSSKLRNTRTLFDFARCDEIEHWEECSDTKKPFGDSKAVLVIKKSQTEHKAVLFTILNPNSSGKVGSCFAGIFRDVRLDLSDFKCIAIKCRGQGINSQYKMLLHHDSIGKDAVVYGQTFVAPQVEFSTVKLALANFKPYFKARKLPTESYNLDPSVITRIILKMDNGSFLPNNQHGVSALEIEWIKATK